MNTDGHNKSEEVQTSATHELREDTISLSNSRHQKHMNTEDTIQTSVTHEHRPDIINMNNSRHHLYMNSERT